MPKATILQFITGLNPGGAEKMMAKTIAQLDKKKYRILVASLVSGTMEQELRKKYPVTVLNANSIFSFPRAIRQLRALIKQEDVDIVHSYLYHANIISRFAAKGTRAKVISSVRIKEIKKKSHNIIDMLTSHHVDMYTVVANNVRNWLISKEHINPKRIITIPNGLDFTQFNVLVNTQKKREQLGIPKDSKILISVANLRKTKDYPTLFKALQQVLRTKHVELLVVGKGEAESEYRALARKLGVDAHVHFLGFRDDVFKLIKISDICILSTHYEGMSNALLEYMAMKKPIIATAIEENKEVLTTNKEGLLTPEQQPELMAKAIIKLLDDAPLRKRLSANAYKRVKTYHDIKRVAKQTEELYEDLLR